MSYECKICNKHYKSYQSKWNHHKKFHNDNVIHSDTSVIPNVILCNKTDTIDKPILYCKFCNRQFNFRNNRWKHEKICKKKENIEDTKKIELELKMKQEEVKLKKEEAEMDNFMLKYTEEVKNEKQRIKKSKI